MTRVRSSPTPHGQTSLLLECTDCATAIIEANYADGPRHVRCAWAARVQTAHTAPQPQGERNLTVWLRTMRMLGYAITGPWYERGAQDAETPSRSAWDIPREQRPIKDADGPHLPYVDVLARGCPGGDEVPERMRGMGGVWVCYLRHWHPMSADERREQLVHARDASFQGADAP